MTCAISLLQSLIEIPSITPQDLGCQQLLANRLEQMGFTLTHYPIGEVQNLWAVWGKTPTLCFAGHTDVVPPGPLDSWQTPPFTPTILDGYLYGRGAADMKSGIAAMITACERIYQRDPTLLNGMAFLITSDEEGQAKDGTQAVLKKLSCHPKACIVGEATSLVRLGDTIKIGRRGSITGYLTIQGKQGHVAYPHLATNAIHQAMGPLQSIVNIEWDQGTEHFSPTSLQITDIQAGTGANNVIPGTLQVVFNCRFAPCTSPDTIKQKISQILSDQPCPYTLEWHQSAKPFMTDSNSQFVKRVVETVETECGVSPQLCTKGGTSDGRFFAESGIEVIELGPCNQTIHQANECIAIDDVQKLSEVYEKILMACLPLYA